MASAYRRYTEAMAAEIVDRYWYLVEALAVELVASRTLSGVAVHEVLRRAIRAESDRLQLEWPVFSDVDPRAMSAFGWRARASFVAVMRREASEASAEDG